ncbi:MAG: hypothetical protein RIR93_930, partial [Actinomycetota bacterium]
VFRDVGKVDDVRHDDKKITLRNRQLGDHIWPKT